MRLLLLSPLLLLPLTACRTTQYRASFHQPAYRARVDKKAPFLKVHTAKGELLVLADWRIDEKKRQVEGSGLLYDVGREIADRGVLTVSFDRIVMLETNTPERVSTHRQFTALSILTVATVGFTVYCITQPAFCFSGF